MSKLPKTVSKKKKAMVISGLRTYDKEKVQAMVDNYSIRKQHLAS